MNDHLSADLQKKQDWMVNLEAETTDKLSESWSLKLILDQKDRMIRELEAGKKRALHKPKFGQMS